MSGDGVVGWGVGDVVVKVEECIRELVRLCGSGDEYKSVCFFRE